MPNGKTHDIITIITAPFVVEISYLITDDIKQTAIFFILFLFSSLMFNGDLDTNSRPYNRWWIFKMIWIPYQLLFTHRSIFTHGFIIGTLIRLLYLGIVPLIVLIFKDNLQMVASINLNMFLLIFLGLETGSAIHTISDKIF